MIGSGYRRSRDDGWFGHRLDRLNDRRNDWLLRAVRHRLLKQAGGYLLRLFRRLLLRRLRRGLDLDRPYRDHIHVQSLTMEMEAVVSSEVGQPDRQREREHLGQAEELLCLDLLCRAGG